jgi:hypothetical protein
MPVSEVDHPRRRKYKPRHRIGPAGHTDNFRAERPPGIHPAGLCWGATMRAAMRGVT